MNGFKQLNRSKLAGKLESRSIVQQSMQQMLVQDPEIRTSRDVTEKEKAPIYKLRRLSDIIASTIRSSNDLRTVTHHIKRAEQIWKTLLLKPNGDQPNILTYDTQKSDVKSSALHDSLIQVIQNYFTTKYPIENEIPQIIEDVLFRKGAHVTLNIPHCVLDHLINGYEVTGRDGFESILKPELWKLQNKHFTSDFSKAKNIGLIRKTKVDDITTVGGLESLYSEKTNGGEEFELVAGNEESLGWTFTDNIQVLNYYRAANVIKQKAVATRGGLEGFSSLVRNTITKKSKEPKPDKNNVNVMSAADFNSEMNKLYPTRYFRQSETISIREQRFYTGAGKGNGITYTPPMESCIPVNLPGRGGEPFGYIFLTDPKTGEFLATATDMSLYYKDNGRDRDISEGASSLDQVIRHLKSTNDLGKADVDMSWVMNVAIANLERSFIESFINGDAGKEVSISLTTENKKIFLSRALKGQGVRSIFVPASYVTYIAMDYNDAGIGRSMVEEAKLHITRLAVLETADILANVENSISHTELTIGLEKESFDSRQVVELVRNAYFANNPTLHDIIGYNDISIDGILDRFREQSLTIKVNGGDSKTIATPEIEARQADREPIKSIDSATRENLLNTVAGYFCLKRSWLDDTGDGNDFAVEAIAEQELLRNQTTDFSRRFSAFISDIIRKHIIYNENLVEELIEKIMDADPKMLNPDQGKEFADGEGERLSKEARVELILTDFVNGLFVQLPAILVSESLDKVANKVKSIADLAEDWYEMSSGKDVLEKRAEELGLDPESIKNVLKATFKRHAYAKYNLPVPYEEIVEDGNKGGIVAYINTMTNLDRNIVSFLEEWYKHDKTCSKGVDKLKERIEKDRAKIEEAERAKEEAEQAKRMEAEGGMNPGAEGDYGSTTEGGDNQNNNFSWDSETTPPADDGTVTDGEGGSTTLPDDVTASVEPEATPADNFSWDSETTPAPTEEPTDVTGEPEPASEEGNPEDKSTEEEDTLDLDPENLGTEGEEETTPPEEDPNKEEKSEELGEPIEEPEEGKEEPKEPEEEPSKDDNPDEEKEVEKDKGKTEKGSFDWDE